MSSPDMIRQLSQLLFRHRFLTTQEIGEHLGVSEDDLNDLFDLLDPILDSLGLTLEVVELQGTDYAFISLPSAESPYSEKEIGILTLFGFTTKVRGGRLTSQEVASMFAEHLASLEKFKEEGLLVQEGEGFWQLSPIGASLVLPLLPQVQPLLHRLLNSEDHS